MGHQYGTILCPSYKYKDYSDWFLRPMPELYIRDGDVPNAPVANIC